MDLPLHEMEALEFALMRRGVDELAADCDRCARCDRIPLIGERVYTYGSGATLCELCRSECSEVPQHSRLVHGPEFGHTIRITDRRRVA